MQLIGLIGRARSGKSTVAKHLVDNYGFFRFAFADPLKEMLMKAGMCTYGELYANKTEQSRWLMQKIGTDIFRKQIDELFWIKKAQEMIQGFIRDNHQKIVVEDIRFPNEAELVKEFGGTVIKLVRSEYFDDQTDNSHLSESLVDSIEADRVIGAQSGDVPGLLQEIDKYMRGE